MRVLLASLQWCQVGAILTLALHRRLQTEKMTPTGALEIESAQDEAMEVARNSASAQTCSHSHHPFSGFWLEPNRVGFLWS
jgi:hypothetical protein